MSIVFPLKNGVFPNDFIDVPVGHNKMCVLVAIIAIVYTHRLVLCRKL